MITKFDTHKLLNSDKYIENIDEKTAIKLIEKGPFKPNEKYPIYRIVQNNDGNENNYENFNVINPKLITRISPNYPNNLYNLFFSYDESWSKYPKRNKSLICGDIGVRNRHGILYVVIPLEKRKIAISHDDIWDSFRYLNEYIDTFFDYIQIELNIFYNSYDDFLKLL